MRIKGVEGVPPAVDPDDERRNKKRDPGAESKEVLAALQAGAANAKWDKELTIALLTTSAWSSSSFPSVRS